MKYESGIVDRALTVMEKVDTADTEFKKHRISIVELLDEEYVDAEQGVLDSHEDEVLDLTRLERLINDLIQQDKTPVTMATERRLEHLDKKVTSVNEAVSKLTSDDDVCLIRLYDEQLDTFKVEVDDIYRSVLNSDKPEDEELSIRQTKLAQKLFDFSLVVKRLLEKNSPTPTPTSTPTCE